MYISNVYQQGAVQKNMIFFSLDIWAILFSAKWKDIIVSQTRTICEKKEITTYIKGDSWFVKKIWRDLYNYNEKKITSRKEVNSWIKIGNNDNC